MPIQIKTHVHTSFSIDAPRAIIMMRGFWRAPRAVRALYLVALMITSRGLRRIVVLEVGMKSERVYSTGSPRSGRELAEPRARLRASALHVRSRVPTHAREISALLSARSNVLRSREIAIGDALPSTGLLRGR